MSPVVSPFLSELESLDPVDQSDHIEIDQKTCTDLGELHICKKLRPVNVAEAVDGLQFDYQLAVHEQVETIAAIDSHALVLYGNRMFRNEGYASLMEFVRDALVIGRLKQTRSERAMNLDRALNHTPR